MEFVIEHWIWFVAIATALFFTSGIINIYWYWQRCDAAGYPVSFMDIISIKARKLPCDDITEAYVRLRSNGAPFSLAEVTKEYVKDPWHFQEWVLTAVDIVRGIDGDLTSHRSVEPDGSSNAG